MVTASSIVIQTYPKSSCIMIMRETRITDSTYLIKHEHIRVKDDPKITCSRCARNRSVTTHKRHIRQVRYFRILFRKTSEKESSV